MQGEQRPYVTLEVYPQFGDDQLELVGARVSSDCGLEQCTIARSGLDVSGAMHDAAPAFASSVGSRLLVCGHRATATHVGVLLHV